MAVLRPRLLLRSQPLPLLPVFCGKETRVKAFPLNARTDLLPLKSTSSLGKTQFGSGLRKAAGSSFSHKAALHSGTAVTTGTRTQWCGLGVNRHSEPWCHSSVWRRDKTCGTSPLPLALHSGGSQRLPHCRVCSPSAAQWSSFCCLHPSVTRRVQRCCFLLFGLGNVRLSLPLFVDLSRALPSISCPSKETGCMVQLVRS